MHDIVDLRSDTMTLPTPAMREAMARAEVGDDVWEEDPTVKRLEALSAERMNKEAGLFVTSGTQGNLLSVLAQTQPGCEVIRAVAAVARAAGVPVHLDGARLFNAAVALKREPREFTRYADSVTFCVSKGLGAPVGSVVCGTSPFIARARRLRKMLGGGMRQAGVIAAAGIVALERVVDPLADDHT